MKKLLCGWVIVAAYLIKARQKFNWDLTNREITKFVVVGDVGLAYDLIKVLKRRPYVVGRKRRTRTRS